jgi:hypothetical protein
VESLGLRRQRISFLLDGLTPGRVCLATLARLGAPMMDTTMGVRDEEVDTPADAAATRTGSPLFCVVVQEDMHDMESRHVGALGQAMEVLFRSEHSGARVAPLAPLCSSLWTAIAAGHTERRGGRARRQRIPQVPLMNAALRLTALRLGVAGQGRQMMFLCNFLLIGLMYGPENGVRHRGGETRNRPPA